MHKKHEKQASPQREHASTDVSQIKLDDVNEGEFPRALESDFRVLISAEAFAAIRKHGSSDKEVELCGVLAGHLLKDASGPYLTVEKAVAGAATRQTGSRVTFTHETWSQIHKQLDAEAPDLQIVGWYHTHPGFGIFMSDMDQFIQDNFFNLPHNVAFVYDPVSEQSALFVWRDGRSAKLRRYWLAGKLVYDLEPDTPADESAAIKEKVDKKQAATREPEPARGAEPAAKTASAWPVIFLIGLLASFWLGGYMNRSAFQDRDGQTKAIENLIRTGLFRDNLGLRLTPVIMSLDRAFMLLDKAQKAGGEEGSADMEKAAEMIRDVHGEVSAIRQAYTQADRLAARMEITAMLPDELRQQRAALVGLSVLQARALLDGSSSTAEKRRELAGQLRLLAVNLAPEQKAAIDEMLPELVPAETKTNEEQKNDKDSSDSPGK